MFEIEKLQKYPIYKKYESMLEIPFFTKNMYMKNFPEMWMTDLLKKRILENSVEYASTSGTSSERMMIIRPKNWWKSEFDFYYSLHPVLSGLINSRKASLTTAVCSETVCFKEDPGMEKRLINGSLYLNLSSNPFDWSKGDIERIIQELQFYKPEILDIDPIYFSIFWDKLKRYGLFLTLDSVKAITTCYEFLSISSINSIKEFMPDIPIVNVFGSTETGILYLQDIQSNCLYFSPLRLKISFQDLHQNSNLKLAMIDTHKNIFMPLVKYVTDDLFMVWSDANSNHFRYKGRRNDLIFVNDKFINLDDLDQMLEPISSEIVAFQAFFGKSNLKLNIVIKFGSDIDADAIAKVIASKLNLSIQCSIIKSFTPEKSGKFKMLQVKETEF
jgi:phenylacetate-CoA ligase